MRTSEEFRAKQLCLLFADWLAPEVALAVVNATDLSSANALLDTGLEFVMDEISADQHQAAQTYLAALVNGDAPASRGETREDAIIIICDNSEEGIQLQYDWLDWRFGERDVDWKPETRGHEPNEHDEQQVFDWFVVKPDDAPSIKFEFDISSFYGRW